MGFPDSMSGDISYFPIQNFRTWIAGKPIKTIFKLKKRPKGTMDDPEGAHVWNVRFKKGETITVKNSYWTGIGEQGYGDAGVFKFIYVVKTGARWKDKIETAEFYIDLSKAPHSPIFNISPKPRSVTNGVYYLKFTNFKPDFNISVGGIGLNDYSIKYIKKQGINYMFKASRVFGGRYGSVVSAELRDAIKKLPNNPQDFLNYLRKHHFDKKTIRIFRNFIFAVHGRSFRSSDLKAYYMSQSWWYKEDPKFSTKKLLPIDRSITSVLLKYENSL